MTDELIPSYDDPAETARQIAADITAWRRRLDKETEAGVRARLAGARRAPGRGVKHLMDDRRVIEGMVRALAYIIGHPGEYWAAERFIREQDQEEGT